MIDAVKQTADQAVSGVTYDEDLFFEVGKALNIHRIMRSERQNFGEHMWFASAG